MKMSVFEERFACLCSCQQCGHSIFKLCDLISSYGVKDESFKQNNNVQKSCDTVPLRHFNGVAALLKSNTLKRSKFQ